ncbi:MAG TPA: hypothetical protein VJ649_07140, partial [Actinomycetes bacterium]|nr:hypothetical protein [Actinomycetes bacterium]
RFLDALDDAMAATGIHGGGSGGQSAGKEPGTGEPNGSGAKSIVPAVAHRARLTVRPVGNARITHAAML